MSWTENINLLNKQETMTSKDLFQAVCDEIGKYYESKKPPLKTEALIFRLDPKGHKTH